MRFANEFKQDAVAQVVERRYPFLIVAAIWLQKSSIKPEAFHVKIHFFATIQFKHQ